MLKFYIKVIDKQRGFLDKIRTKFVLRYLRKLSIKTQKVLNLPYPGLVYKDEYDQLVCVFVEGPTELIFSDEDPNDLYYEVKKGLFNGFTDDLLVSENFMMEFAWNWEFDDE